MKPSLRPITADEFEAFSRTAEGSFGKHPDQAFYEAERPLLEWDRTLAAFDGDQLVATAAAFTFRISVPGGILPAAGVTWVGVLPTHRRRGLLTALMRRQLADVHDRGEPLAVLVASEGGIYGRFGYGPAADLQGVSLDRGAALAHAPAPSDGARLVGVDEARAALPPIYDRVRLRRPGVPDRSPAWWQYLLFGDRPDQRDGASALFYVLHGSGDGYAAYRMRPAFGEDRLPDGTVEVVEVIAATLQAYADLWRYLLDLDLTVRVVAENRPADEPLRWLLADARQLRARPGDALWARLVNMPVALRGRAYSDQGALTLRVHDEVCPWNDGTWLLEAGPGGAKCRAANGPPDLELSAAELAAVYLGGQSVNALVAAGRICQHVAGAARRAQALFSWDVQPWCPHEF